MDRRWTVESTRILFTGHPHRLRLDTCRTASGSLVRDYFVREVNDVAMVVALTPDDRCVLVRQYRHGAGLETLELPQGLFEDGESPEQAGARELAEETGFAAPRLVALGAFYTSPAVQTNRVHVFLGTGALDLGARNPDPDEDIEVSLVATGDLEGLVLSGAVRATSSVAGIYLALRHLERAGVP